MELESRCKRRTLFLSERGKQSDDDDASWSVRLWSGRATGDAKGTGKGRMSETRNGGDTRRFPSLLAPCALPFFVPLCVPVLSVSKRSKAAAGKRL
jgi:hypothetical protein